MNAKPNPSQEMMEVLIAEDSPTQAEQLRHLLEQHGYRVTVTDNGKEALAFLDQHTPTLVITDIVMPEMTGFELCQRIKENERLRDTPVVLLTSLATSEDVLEGLASGADSFITKPYSEEYLLTNLQQILANRRLRNGERVRIGVEILFAGKKRFITADQQQMLTLLISTYEAAVHRNGELIRTQNELNALNARLEDMVAQRTAALQESEAKYRTMVENVAIGVALISPDMEVIEMNRQMQAWFPEAAGQSNPVCYRVFNDPPGESACPSCPVAKALRDGEVHEATAEKLRAGRVRHYRIVASPVLDARGNVTGAIELLEDVTERMSMEEQLRQAQKMEAVGQLAGGVAHDFNNILQAMMGYSSMLLDRLPEHDEMHEFAEEIAHSTERACALTRQLLAFSRRQILEMEDLDLNDVVHGLAKMLRRLIGENIEVDVIESRRLGIVHADRGQMEQVLLNLCVNARDAMPEGGKLSVETENVVMDNEYCATHAWATPGRYVLLSVTDTGCGMDAETKERIFEPFFTTKELDKGTGLGLATVYGIVRQHQGMIQVYSEVEKGTTFKVYLPSIERAAASVGPKVVGRPEGGTETILVAEDNEPLRKLVARILESAGYAVLLAADGREAIEMFRQGAADIQLVLADVVMPKVGGRGVYDALHEQYPHLRFLFSSGYTTNAIHTGFVLEKGFELIQKPYAPGALLRKVRDVLDR